MGGRSREERPVGSDGQRAHGPQGVTSGLPSVSRTCLFQTPHTNSQTPCDLSCLAVYIPYIVPIFSSVQSLSWVRLFATPWTAARQASLSITSTQSLPKPMSIESVMPSNHLILCRPLLLLPSVFPSIRVFSNESALHIRWPVLEFQLQHQSFQ